MDPGHSGIEGNQIADRLAKAAINIPIGPGPVCRYSEGSN